jgi:hypothetical protein
MFITFHNHYYLCENFRIKKPSSKVKIKKLINYSTVWSGLVRSGLLLRLKNIKGKKKRKKKKEKKL